MSYALYSVLFALGLFSAMLVLLEAGRRIGVRRMRQDAEGSNAGLGVIESAVVGLFGLLIAFTFSGAASRFDTRRRLIVEETNAIGTAYLRVDLLAGGAQPALRELFRNYVRARLEAYQKFPDLAAVQEALAKANQLQTRIWNAAVTASRASEAHPDAAMLLLPALNEMIDITTTRTMAIQTHPPPVVFIMLWGMALVSALLAGNGMAAAKRPNWLYMLCFAAVVAVAAYVILDLEYPRLGLIRVDAFDQALVQLYESIN